MPDRNELPHNCQRISFEGRYCGEPTQGSVSYGSWSDDKSGNWFLCDSLGYSDYSNSKPYGESNVRVFAEQFSEGEGKWWQYAHGGYDTTAIVIRTLAYRNYSDLREAIDGLSDYPLLDEDDCSDLESEREQEGWEDYGRSDFKRTMKQYIAKRFEDRDLGTDADDKDADDIVDALKDSQLDALYYHLCQETNVNGGSTCMFEGESHPHFFDDEVIWGRAGRSYKGIDRDAWDGLVPSLDEDGEKVEYQAGEIVGWEPVCQISPACPRCGKLTPIRETENPTNLWEAPCSDYGCDIPDRGLLALPEISDLAAFILRSWDVGESKGDVGPSFDKLAKYCEAQGDKRSALALHFRDGTNTLTVHNETRKLTRGVLKAIIRGELPKPSTLDYPYLNDKPVCCLLRGEGCCEHGTWCVLRSSKGACPVHGKIGEKETNRMVKVMVGL